MGSHHPPAEPHHHHHGEAEETYYIDQLCMIALSGAFGAICLSLWFLNPAMLNRMLADQLHIYVLLSGIALTLIAAIRAWVLWLEAGRETGHAHDHAHDHDHAYDHDHSHDHGHDHSHSHDHAHDQGDHAHSHAGHNHGRNHGHDHSAEDHEHGWAPWRYVVMLTPIILFLLGLPSTLPAVQVSATSDYTMAAESAGLVGMGADTWAWLGQAAYYGADSANEPAQDVKFKVLESTGESAASREYWNDKLVSVVGQFYPSSNSQNVFFLVRYKINCCYADAIPRRIAMRSRESVAKFKAQNWVEVRGRIQFQMVGDTYVPVLNVASARNIRDVPPDIRPYVE